MWAWIRRGAIAVGVLGGLAVALAAGVVGWGLATWERTLAFPDTPYPALAASTDPAWIERGRYLVHGPAHCAQCHSTSDRDHPEDIATTPLRGGLAFEMGPIGTLYARNLTPDPETGIGRRSDAELARVLRTGVLPEGELSVFMRYSAAKLSDDDIRAVLSYLRSVPPVRHEVPDRQITLLGKLVVKFAFAGLSPRPSAGPAGVAPVEAPDVARGAYLADEVMLCTTCHTALDPATFEPVGPKAAGGTVEASHDDPAMEWAPPNLTASPTGVTGVLDEDAFVARMRAGRAHLRSIMPWENVAATSDADLRSVYRYLRTLPPVDRDTGPGYRPVGWTAR